VSQDYEFQGFTEYVIENITNGPW